MTNAQFPRYFPDGTGHGQDIVLEGARVRVFGRDGDYNDGLILEVKSLGLFLRLDVTGDEVFYPWGAIDQVTALLPQVKA
jgi:hypothetical protein